MNAALPSPRTAVGIVPGAVACAVLGDALRRPGSVQFVVAAGVVAALLAVSAAAMAARSRRRA